MLVAFLGPPMSGKTTVAAAVYSQLKQNGLPAEFISERARWYIAKLKYQNRLALPLTDFDQASIMVSQDEAEAIMTTTSPDSIVVADSCTLNSIFYMTRQSIGQISNSAMRRYSDSKNLLYFAQVIPDMGSTIDTNRVHTIEESRTLSIKMKEYVDSCIFNIKPLAGTLDMRVNQVLRDVNELYNGGN